ncbi:hypothetical protein HK101_003318, partial [Irineochytrium annulatum]
MKSITANFLAVAAGFALAFAQTPKDDVTPTHGPHLDREFSFDYRLEAKYKHQKPPPPSGTWSPYYNNTMTDYDWINLRQAIADLVQVYRLGPVFLRLAWHDAATASNVTGTGGPHATMNVQYPMDPGNK